MSGARWMTMRRRVLCWLVRDLVGIPEGGIMPAWLQVIRAVVFPLEFLAWRLGQMAGYQFDTDTWRINGACFSADGLARLARADGGLYIVSRPRCDGTITFTQVGMVIRREPEKPAAELVDRFVEECDRLGENMERNWNDDERKQ